MMSSGSNNSEGENMVKENIIDNVDQSPESKNKKSKDKDKGNNEKAKDKDKEKSVDIQMHKGASMYKAVKLDVVELLKQVLEWTPLYKPGLNIALLQASKMGSIGCVKVLLTAGAEADTEDENGDTPFVHAFRCGHQEIMEVLHDNGCTTEIAKMSLALASKDPDFVKLCLRLDIPVENEDWNTSDIEEVKILLDDLQLDPFEGQYGGHGFEDSPFMYLAQEGKPEILDKLLTDHPCKGKYTEDDLAEKINCALHKAIIHHRLDNVKLLMASCGASLEAKDGQNRTSFTLACGHDETIAQYLLELGSSTEVKDLEGLTPLHWAACSGYASLCQNLLAKSMDVNAKAKLGATPLMVACSNGHGEIAQMLLKAGTNVNAATPEGWTALHVAARACFPGIVKTLLHAGASPNVHSSKLTHNSDMCPASTPLLMAIALNSMKMIRHLLNANCDINLPGLVYTNPSFSSSESDDDYKFQKQRCSPVQYAIISRAWDIAELLIKAGCNVASIRLWLEYKHAPVHIPEDKSKYLRHLIYLATASPAKLRHLVRRKIRQTLGRDLVTGVEELEIPEMAKQYILLQDLFRAAEGSFEV